MVMFLSQEFSCACVSFGTGLSMNHWSVVELGWTTKSGRVKGSFRRWWLTSKRCLNGGGACRSRGGPGLAGEVGPAAILASAAARRAWRSEIVCWADTSGVPTGTHCWMMVASSWAARLHASLLPRTSPLVRQKVWAALSMSMFLCLTSRCKFVKRTQEGRSDVGTM